MAEKKENQLWSIGGAKLSKSKERVNLSIIRTAENGTKEYGTISINIKKGTKSCRVKVKDDEVIIGICRKDIGGDAAELEV